MSTTAGSLALAGSIAARDSFVAERLRAAGAVILGKTNLSEWANFRSTHSVSGWSGRGGLTHNPYALDRNPSGSSAGSGAAAAASFCAVAVGTETDGSVTAPSSVNGLVGIKPTLGLIGRSGIVPISHSQDTAGPMARTVRDAAILLGAMAGVDPRDPATQAASRKNPERLHEVPRSARVEGRAPGCGAQVLRRQRRHRSHHRGLPGADEARRAPSWWTRPTCLRTASSMATSSRCCCTSSKPISTNTWPASGRRCARDRSPT